MNEPRICPLLMIGSPMGAATGAAGCKGDRCAWAYEGGCAITAIAEALDSLDQNGIGVYPEEADT